MPSCFSIPPQSHFVRQLPRRRWRLLVQYKLKAKSLPVEGGGFCEAKDGGSLPALKGEVDASETSRRRGCIEVALVYANPSAKPSVCQLPSRGAFWVPSPRMHAPDIPQIIAYMLKLTSISCFSIVMPIYIDNLMIIGYLITIRRGLCMKEINSFG